MKRTRDDGEYCEQPEKVRRIDAQDRISKLSDEILVRILSFATVPTLLICQRYIYFQYFYICDCTKISIEFLRNSAVWQSTQSCGSLLTTKLLSCRGQHEYRASEMPVPPPIICDIPRNFRNGWTMDTL